MKTELQTYKTAVVLPTSFPHSVGVLAGFCWPSYSPGLGAVVSRGGGSAMREKLKIKMIKKLC